MVANPEVTFCSIANLIGEAGVFSRFVHHRHNRPIASHFHSVALELFYLSEDLDEADG
jgi:hypothetical protein